MKPDRLSQAVALEQKARGLEAEGLLQDAFREYKGCLEVYKFVYRWESNPRIQEIIRGRMEELVGRAEAIQGAAAAGAVATPARAPAAPQAKRLARAPSSLGGPAPSEADSDTKETERLRKGLEGSIMTDKPDVRWDDIAGLQGAKEALQESVILPTRFPQLFTGKREPWHGILLYGPPGTGKSFLAKACATETDATFFSISSSDLVSKWMGESERLVRNLFDMARESRPSIIFVDEVDSLCGTRGESGESDAARRIKTEFLTQMDGVGKSRAQILVLGATNTPWDLDAAIRRRFEKRIYIPLPDVQARIHLLKLCMGETPHQCSQADLASIAKRAEGFSGADISILVRDAIYEPVRRCRDAEAFKQVTRAGPDGAPSQYWTPCKPYVPGARRMTLMQVRPDELLPPDVLPGDFESAIRKVRPSVSPNDLRRFENFTKLYGVEGAPDTEVKAEVHPPETTPRQARDECMIC